MVRLRYAALVLALFALGACEGSSVGTSEHPGGTESGGQGGNTGGAGGSVGGTAGLGGSAGYGGVSGRAGGGTAGMAGFPSCCPENPCKENERLELGQCAFDANCRRVTTCSCEVGCYGPISFPKCDPGDERVDGECPAEEGCYARYELAMVIWCRHVESGGAGAGGEGGEAGENAR